VATPPDELDEPDLTRTNAAGDLLAPGTLVAGRYRVEELIGVGGMGMVYRARDERLGLPVAVKVLRPELAAEGRVEERLVRELVLARQVSHKNVVRIHDLGEEDDLSFLTMDYVEGRSLQEVLREDGPLPAERAVGIARQLAEALAAAHAEAVVHRDLKPANVLLDPAGRAYVTDFGVARSLGGGGLTRTGRVLGTLAYLSPEQARGEPVDGRSDLYALGVVLFEMLTGELPFPGETPSEVMAQRLAGAPRTLRRAGLRTSLELDRVLARCLARDPDDRYPDAESLAADLAALATGARLRRARVPASWRRHLPWAAAFVGVAAAALLAAWWYARGRPAGPGAAAVHAVAVLPFSDETGRAELAWTPTGVAEMLAAALAESPDLRVAEALRVASTMRDLGISAGALSEAEVRQVTDLLDVDRLVTGTLRAAGNRVRLEARLLDAERPAAAGRPADPLSAETVVAADLFEAVGALGRELRRRLEVRPPATPDPVRSASPAAMAAYARGMEALLADEPLAAAPALEEAVAADPSFGAAWLRLAAAREELGHHDEALEAARAARRELGAGGGRLALEARARAAALAGEPERARETFAALVAAYPHDGEARLALAEAFGEEGRFREARETLEALVAEEPDHPRAWYLLGKFAVLAGDSRRAADEYLVRALVIQNRLGNDRGRADVLNALGVAHGDLGEADRAAERYREAAEVRRKIGDRRGYAATLANLGTLEFLGGDFEAGRGRLEEAAGIRRELGDREGLAHLENELGILEEERGRYEEALAHYRRGLQMRQELGDRRALAESLNNVGFAYYLLGEYDNAGVYWQRALELYRGSGNREGVVIADQSLGLLDLVRGEWPEALDRFLGTLAEARDLDLRQAEAVAQGQLGRVAQLQGRYGAALESFGKALEVVGALGDPRGLAEFTLFQAGAYLDLGRLDAAEASLDRVAEWVTEGGNREQEAELERLRGELLLARSDAAGARRAFERALESATASGSFVAERAARIGLARTDLATGRPREAARALAAVLDEARGAGCATLLLEASVPLAQALRQSGDPDGAEEVGREALRVTLGAGGYGEAWKLHRALAEARGDRGESADAARAWSLAADEVRRLGEAMGDDERRSFEGLAEVQEIVERARAG
jgi:tetratricopeptide (TPR) repeat protein